MSSITARPRESEKPLRSKRPPRKKRASLHMRQQQRSAYLFISLPLFLFILFAVVPVVWGLAMSLTNYSVIGQTSWEGFSNFTELFSDPIFWLALKNTAIYTLMYVPLGIVVALGTAMLLNRSSRAVKLFRTFFFVPVVCSSVASATIWYWMLNPDYGMINVVLGWFGINGPAWLYSSQWAMTAIVMMSVWSSFGTNMMIFLGGLQNVSPDLVEAAELDGAGPWKRFWHVTLPQLRPTTFLVSTLLLIQAFQVFDQAYVLTQGGPGNSTLTLVYYIYNEGFGDLRMGYAAAMSFVLFIIIAAFSLLNARITNRDNGQEA